MIIGQKIKTVIRPSLRRFQRFFGKGSFGNERILITPEGFMADARKWHFYKESFSGQPRVLMASGHGYGNLGDEAQCGACIDRWRRVAPDCRLTVFSPNPAYTEAVHHERCEWAPRISWFKSNSNGVYAKGEKPFVWKYRFLRFRLELSVRFIRADIPITLLLPREAHILQLVLEHDLLHISGGGFLTGKTRSRLWENCLLMRMCELLKTPVMLTGHNIGVFQDSADQQVAKLGLRKVAWIGLRDKGMSAQELADIGIEGDHVFSGCDDALLCPRLETEEIESLLSGLGLDSKKPWVAVNFHYWGQALEVRKRIEARFAEICDLLVSKHQLQVVFIAMLPGDALAEQSVLDQMKNHAILLPYSPDYKVVRGVIADAEMVFTMKHHPIVFAQGEGVPVVSVALDDYYFLKNKGALSNTGHGEFLANEDGFYGSEVSALITRALDKRQEISSEMLEYKKSMMSIELEPYQKQAKIITGHTSPA